ncbi:MAG: outer membrane protein assembly factor BamD [Saprospiraceae bacterium]|nr:outer membrane protein assembly factor BamD [Saprospiraceae bacterium]
MKKSVLFILISFMFIACKSEFERVRTSNDPELLYKKALEFYDKEDWVKAQTLLELSIPNYRGKSEAEELFLKFAYTHYYNNEFILSAHYFKSFATTFYNSDQKEEAEFMSAYSNYRLSPNHKLDQTYTEKAIEGFQLFVNTFPRSERVAECNELIDKLRIKLEEKALAQGELYYNIGQYEAAVKSFSNMLNDFPDASQAERARYLMLKATYEFAKKSIFGKKRERFEEAEVLYSKFIKKHPTSKYSDEVTDIHTNTVEELKKLKA